MLGTKHGILLFLGTAALTLVSSRAAAQDQLEQAIYSDVKTVIGDVITADVAHNVAPNFACLSGREKVPAAGPGIYVGPPAAPGGTSVYFQLEATRYFPGSLQLIYNQNFGGLRSSLVHEAAALVGDIGYKVLVPPARPAPPKARLTLLGAELSAIKSAISPSGAPPIFDVLPSEELDGCHDQLVAQLANGTLGTAKLPLDQECAAGAPGRSEYACDLAYAISDLIQGDSADAKTSLTRALAEIIGELVLGGGSALSQTQLNSVIPIVNALLTGTPPPASSIPPVPAPAPPAPAPAPAHGPAPAPALLPAGATACSATTWPTASQPLSIEQAYWLLESGVGKPLSCPLVPSPALANIRDLVGEWRTIGLSGTPGGAVQKFFDQAILAGGVLATLCTGAGSAPAVCTLLPNAKTLLGDPNLWAMISAAANGDFPTAAGRATIELFRPLDAFCDTQVQLKQPTSETCRLKPLYEDFAKTVVVYTAQSIQSQGAPSEAARQAFQTAATDLLLEIGQGGGIDRPRLFTGGWPLPIVLPDLALRYSWSPTYIDGGGGTSGRVVASLPWINFRAKFVRTDLVFLGLELSLLDPLAPLSELAIRQPTTQAIYNNQTLLWANFFSPRLDLNIGVPALSKNLLVGAGLSYRIAAPFLTTGIGATPPQFAYKTCGDSSTYSTALTCFEFGVFVKYAL